jgi:hypothetical protein
MVLWDRLLSEQNIGFVNPSNQAANVTVTLYDDYSNVIGVVNKTVGPFKATQITDVFNAAGIGAFNYQGARAEVTSNVAVISYASVVDNNSGDPIYVPGFPAGF